MEVYFELCIANTRLYRCIVELSALKILLTALFVGAGLLQGDGSATDASCKLHIAYVVIPRVGPTGSQSSLTIPHTVTKGARKKKNKAILPTCHQLDGIIMDAQQALSTDRHTVVCVPTSLRYVH